MKTKQIKQQEATARNNKWAAMTNSQKIDSLNQRQLIAKKQRAKLA